MTARLIPLAALAALAAVLALAAAAPASAQSLLDQVLPQQSAGVCTCATTKPPYDCDADIANASSTATAQRREVRAQCANDLRAQCEDKYGWQTCTGADAQRQIGAQCDGIAQQWWNQMAAPQLNDFRQQCEAANSEWTEHCETVDRPANCATCTQESDRIAELEQQIDDANAWLSSMRSGESLISADDEAVIAQRTDEVERWRRELASKRTSYQMLQDSEFCPTP